MADLIQRAEVEWAEVEADEGAELMERPVRMIAYSGGAIGRDSKGRPTIVDVKGLTIEPNMPLLVSHDEDQIAGNATNVSAESGALAVDGVVYCDEEAGAKVRRYAARPRFKWQASMRFVPERTALLAEGETREVNGRTFSGPAVIVEASRLRECSFVPLGRDPATSAEVFSALSEEERPMAVKPMNCPGHLLVYRSRLHSHNEFPLRIAFHIAFASLWVACPNWSRRADGFGSWVGVSVLSIEQEKLGASFKKMCERFLSNTTAGVLR